ARTKPCASRHPGASRSNRRSPGSATMNWSRSRRNRSACANVISIRSSASANRARPRKDRRASASALSSGSPTKLGGAMITRFIPLLACADIPAEHDFLVRAFGFTPGGVMKDGAGNPIHGEVHAGDQLTIWLHAVSDQFHLAPGASMPNQPGGLVV